MLSGKKILSAVLSAALLLPAASVLAEDETNPYDMVIVLYGDEMTVGAFVLNPEV